MRQTKSPLDRVQILTALRANYINTPDFGVVEDLAKKHRHQDFCVVWYTNHRSERMRLGEANDRFRKNYAIMFHGVPGVSYRALHIGENVYWTMYKNTYSWNSTMVGGTEIYMKTCFHRYHPTIHLPWFSIDYTHVPNSERQKESSMVAIDFNLKPGIRDSVVTKYIDRKKAVSLFKKARRYFEGKS